MNGAWSNLERARTLHKILDLPLARAEHEILLRTERWMFGLMCGCLGFGCGVLVVAWLVVG